MADSLGERVCHFSFVTNDSSARYLAENFPKSLGEPGKDN
jgi:hypothetical protein